MPHVKLTGGLDYASLCKEPPAFRFSVPEDDSHLKFREVFQACGREAALLRYVVTEGRLTQHVQVLVVVDGEGHLVKADRGCPVLRTPGVKLLIASVAAWLVSRHGLVVAKTNLDAFAERGTFWAAHGVPAGLVPVEEIDEG